MIKFVSRTHGQTAWQGKPPESVPQSVDHMTSAELRAVIIEFQPPDASVLVEYDHEVLAARQARDSLLAPLHEVRLKLARVGQQLDRWRSAHPLQARLNELGLMSSGYLDKWRATREALEREAQELADHADRAQERVGDVEKTVHMRIMREQAPLRDYLAELERLERQKSMQELVGRWQTHEFDNALTVFKMIALKREMNAFGYDDNGAHWQALPQSLRRVVDNFNHLPREARPVALDRMRSDIELNRDDARKLMREMGLNWG